MGNEKGTDNKNSKSLRVKILLFLLSLAFWGPRWARRRTGGKGKGTDNKNSKSLRVKG